MDAQTLVPVLVIFFSVAGACAAGFWLLTDPQIVQRRLTRLAPASAAGQIGTSVIGHEVSHAAQRLRSWIPKSPKEMGRIERMMASAGYHGAWPSILFAIAQLALPLAAFTLVWSAMGSLPAGLLAGGLAY